MNDFSAAGDREKKGSSMGQDRQRRKRASQYLLAALDNADLFHDECGVAYGTFADEIGRRRTFALTSEDFQDYCGATYFRIFRDALTKRELEIAVSQLKAQAVFDGSVEQVWVRVGERDGKVFLDLGDETGQVIAIDESGWSIQAESPVKFRRPRGMLALPIPSAEHDPLVFEINSVIPVVDINATALEISWLIGTLNPTGCKPALCFLGQQGSSKSTRSRMLRNVVDPFSPALRSLPRDEAELFIGARNGWISGYDNVSRISDAISDLLCQIATGGGYRKRKLYVDQDEVLFDITRPQILNAISDPIERSDLRERTLVIKLEPMDPRERVTERHLWTAFSKAHPRILGALLDCAVAAIANRDQEVPRDLPRLADWFLWSRAAQAATGLPENMFVTSFEEYCRSANAAALESSPLGSDLLAVARSGFHGSMSFLLERLRKSAGNAAKSREWPNSAQSLRHCINRLEANLRAAGVDVRYDIACNRNRDRLVHITMRGVK